MCEDLEGECWAGSFNAVLARTFSVEACLGGPDEALDGWERVRAEAKPILDTKANRHRQDRDRRRHRAGR